MTFPELAPDQFTVAVISDFSLKDRTKYTLSISHTFPIGWKWLGNIMMYHDFGIIQKWHTDFNNSFQNVYGFLLNMGPVQTYIDYAMGKHQAWIGPDRDAFGPGIGSNSWHARFNINIGYYF